MTSSHSPRGVACTLEENLSSTGEARGDVLTPDRGDETALILDETVLKREACIEVHVQCIKPQRHNVTHAAFLPKRSEIGE